MEREIRKKGPRFCLTDKSRQDVPAEMERLALDGQLSPRTKIAAARVLVTMDKANLEQERLEAGLDRKQPTWPTNEL